MSVTAARARPRARKPTHGGARARAGARAARGHRASVAISVRLTPREAAELDAAIARLPGVTRAAFALAAVMSAVRGDG